MITESTSVAWVKIVWKEKLDSELVSSEVVYAAATRVIRPSVMCIIKMCSNIIYVGLIKKVNKLVFVWWTVDRVLCIEIS